MNVSPYLRSVDLLDCDGSVSHTLTLEIDGTVSVRFRAGHVARVDPASRTVLTPNLVLPSALIDQASRLAFG